MQPVLAARRPAHDSPAFGVPAGKLAAGRRRGDNAGMTGDDSRFRAHLAVLMIILDGARPAGAMEWVSPVAPVITQVAVGAGHWAAGRRRRARAAWVSAAGLGLAAWGLATEAPTQAEHKDLLGKLIADAPAGAGMQALAGSPPAWIARYGAAFAIAALPFSVRSGLRRPRRLTALAIADEVPAAIHVLRVPRAVQRRRLRTAAGSALIVAGAVARLRAVSAEPLR